MKKITLCLMATCLSLSFLPFQSNATNNAIPLSRVIAKPTESDEAKILVLRLNEINAMDMSLLNRDEKKVLRREVRSIKKNLNDNYGGVYISVGGLIVVLLLLIILL